MIKKLTWWELAICVGVVVCVALLVLPVLSRTNRQRHLNSCQYNLMQMGMAFKMYANESPKEMYPPRSPIPGNWTVDATCLYPDYLHDLRLLVCPGSPLATPDTFTLRKNFEHPGAVVGQSHPDCVSSRFYIYLGHIIPHEKVALALYEAAQETPPELLANLDVEVKVLGHNSLRDKMSGSPIMWDRIPETEDAFPHGTPGINVLHMDGSVVFVEYNAYNTPNNFPATYICAETFCRDVPRLSVDCY